MILNMTTDEAHQNPGEGLQRDETPSYHLLQTQADPENMEQK